MPDWLSGAIGGAVAAAIVLLYVRTRRAADVGPRSTPQELDADMERDLEMARLAGRPKL